MNLPCETMVPIEHTCKQVEESIVQVQTKESQADACEKLLGAVSRQIQNDKMKKK